MAAIWKGRLADHTLRVYRIGKSNFSPCLSSCECGASIGLLSSEKQARDWHRQHKDDFVAAAVPQTVVAFGRTPSGNKSRVVATATQRDTAQDRVPIAEMESGSK
jgi:hypothetical protein